LITAFLKMRFEKVEYLFFKLQVRLCFFENV
jgi:hypothetical protein